MPAMIQQQALLHAAGVPTYLLSNCSGLHIGDVARRHPFMATFRGLCLSYAERCFKPEPAIYAAAERITGLQGPDLVFIDDRAENAAAASARGWRAIHHTSAESTLRELHELGLPVVQAR
jgi:2-haloacid dehalogenase